MTPTMIFATVVFTYFSALGLIMSLLWTFKNTVAYKMLSQAAGFDLQHMAHTSDQTSKAMKFLLIDFTSQMAGLNLFALLIIWFPFRQGALWAWFALWFYPVMFAWHYFHYARGSRFSKMQIVYFLLSSVALIITYTQFIN